MDNQYVKAEALRYVILATQRLGNRMLNDLLKEIELTASQAEVIRVLEEWKSLSLKELGKLLICETGSPSRLIERMYQDGLVEKIVDPNDSRFLVLQLTDEGQEKAKAIKQIENQLYDEFKKLYSEEELENIITFLMRFLKDQPVQEALKNRGFSS
ncbi:MarR family winged helix-turn-helix transcriptional regulator [Bacillus sp. 03113]|uniref:MarR family winged helix-turn-helix transcriptional regulator n=1 Tax=Bacillus sp. 03113 TaxID=2578211 RepID=UPI001141CDF4|nr:MarR family transcriptional regulator [Bacillus sp. 03113]